MCGIDAGIEDSQIDLPAGTEAGRHRAVCCHSPPHPGDGRGPAAYPRSPCCPFSSAQSYRSHYRYRSFPFRICTSRYNSVAGQNCTR